MHTQKTDFNRYLKHKFHDADFRARFETADHAWDAALQLAALCKYRGLAQQQVAELLGTKHALGGGLDVTVIQWESPTRTPLSAVRRRYWRRIECGT